MAKGIFSGPLERVDETRVRIPKSYKKGMLVDGMIFADDRLLEAIKNDQAADQVAKYFADIDAQDTAAVATTESLVDENAAGATTEVEPLVDPEYEDEDVVANETPTET